MDRQLEGRAAELFNDHKYAEAAEVYTQCLEVAKEHADRVNILLNRASCHVKESRFAAALADCDEILKDDETNDKALWKKIKVLGFQGSFNDAYSLAKEWTLKDPTSALAAKELKRTEIFKTCTNDKDGDESSKSDGVDSSNSSARSYSTVAAANSNNSSPQYSAVVSGAQSNSAAPVRDGHSLNPYATEFVPRWQH